ncbi:MAG TPA: DNA replication and repair protein RecF [Gemmatimonadota bacterium]|nr:DNA replication and repair protein RecF [Gemmatimonadota bacterium]
MRLTEIGFTHFRNLASTRLEVPPAGAILVGANGQGKTNFLEAIHYLALFRSFRGTRHGDAIAFDAEQFHVEADVLYEDGRSRTITVAADRDCRRIALDGGEALRPAEAVGAVVAVLLAPDDLQIVTGPPAERRRYLDTILALTSRRYWNALQEYARTLRQRNGLLRIRSRAAELEIESWDDMLVVAGTPIVTARAALARRLAARFAEMGGRIAGVGERSTFALTYRASVPVAKEDDGDAARVATAWREALLERRAVDRERGWTTVGPHRDEILVRLAGRPLARFGSQGERRTAAIVLRLLQLEVLEADTGHRPILLLDDVFSELDPGRSGRLLEWLGDAHQRLVTSPRPLPWLDESLARWTVEGGRIARAAA